MAEILVKNGFVVDPTNKIDGEKMDIAIKDGKIVKKVNERKAKIIDASGLTVMAGGVDSQSHRRRSVNMGRLISS